MSKFLLYGGIIGTVAALSIIAFLWFQMSQLYMSFSKPVISNIVDVENLVIGDNPLPLEVQNSLGNFIDWLEKHYTISQGSSALYWQLSYQINGKIVK